MPRVSFVCPNCKSEMCSAIKYWRDGKQTDSFDMYVCHDCGQRTEPGTNEELGYDWIPPRKVSNDAGQINLFGEVKSAKDLVNPVPKIVESPAGLSVTVHKIPKDSPIGYKTAVLQMVRELKGIGTGRHRPHWYKYRRIKRGTK